MAHIIIPVYNSPPLTAVVSSLPLEKNHFDTIYETNGWSTISIRDAESFYSNAKWPPPDELQRSASGGGSDLGIATKRSLKFLKEAITEYNVKSIIDVPCGDVNWIFESFITDTIPIYLGLDIVKDVIDMNTHRFSHHKNKYFSVWDPTTCALPQFKVPSSETKEQQYSFELIHVRDVIQHLPIRKGIRFFCNVFTSGAKVLVTTTYRGYVNENVHEGGSFKNDLEQEPFGFPRGRKCIKTHPKLEDDYTCVYLLTDPWVKDFVAAKC